jgi:signal transduction histidine kinase/ActR/RegA family two-component response regulator
MNGIEEQRLQALYRYKILDTPREEAFDDIARLLAYVCGTSMAIISFVDRDRQWFKAEHGLGTRETVRDVSFCAFCIQQRDVFTVKDARDDHRFDQNWLVYKDPFLRFYASCPLVTPENFAIGTVGVLDRELRELTDDQKDMLRFMSRQVMNLLELRRAKEEAELASKIKDRFLAVLSHELRTPLAAILGWAQLARKGGLPKGGLDEALDVIEQNARLQGTLIEDLLDVSRITAGKLTLDLKNIVLRSLLEKSVNSMRPAAKKKGVSLDFSDLLQPGEQCVVRADEQRLVQVLFNLINNAIKFTPRAGNITVRLEKVDESRVAISVADTGVGISAQFLPSMFEPFSQQFEGHARVYSGLGLGLTIVKHILESLGGDVNAWSEGEGKGSIFRITMPAKFEVRDDTVANGASPKRSSADHVLSDISVLVIEDEPGIRSFLERALADEGAEVVAASSVKEAMDALGVRLYDVILSDVMMPEEDGYDFIRRIRACKDPIRQRVPVVALTALAQEEEQKKLLAAGFDEYVAKPVQLESLISKVKHIARPPR